MDLSQNQPQEAIPIPEQTPQAPAEPEINGKKPFVIIPLLLLIIAAIAFFTTGILSVYANAKIPFISDTNRRSLALFFFNLPLFPKTAEMVLYSAVNKNTKLTTYYTDFSVSSSVSTASLSLFDVDIQAKGPVDVTPNKKPSFDLTAAVGVNAAGQLYKASGNVRRAKDTFYFRIGSLSDNIMAFLLPQDPLGKKQADSDKKEIQDNLKKVFETWIAYDTKGLESEARKALEEKRDDSFVDLVRKDVQEFLLQQSTLKEIKKLPDQRIDNEDSYHLQIIPSRTLTRKLFFKFAKDNNLFNTKKGEEQMDKIINNIEKLGMDVWIGKNDSVLRKVSTVYVGKIEGFVPPSLTGGGPLTYQQAAHTDSFTAPKISWSFVLLLKDVGKPIKTIQKPEKFVTTLDYGNLLRDAGKTKKEKELEAKLNSYNAAFEKIQGALANYYVEKGEYPAILNDLAAEGLSSDTLTYLYQRSNDGRAYVVYIPVVGKETIYYGFSSYSTYPHQLSVYEFQEINNASSSSSVNPQRLLYQLFK